jgi:hypothetical protein
MVNVLSARGAGRQVRTPPPTRRMRLTAAHSASRCRDTVGPIAPHRWLQSRRRPACPACGGIGTTCTSLCHVLVGVASVALARLGGTWLMDYGRWPFWQLGACGGGVWAARLHVFAVPLAHASLFASLFGEVDVHLHADLARCELWTACRQPSRSVARSKMLTLTHTVQTTLSWMRSKSTRVGDVALGDFLRSALLHSSLAGTGSAALAQQRQHAAAVGAC